RLQVGGLLHRLADVVLVAGGIDLVGDHAAGAVGEPQLAAVVLPASVRRHEPHEKGREVAEDERLLLVGLEHRQGEAEGELGRGVGLRQPVADPVAPRLRQRLAHAAGGGPGGVDLLAAERLDYLLAELAQPDRGPGQRRVGADQAEDVALRRRGVPAEDEVGRGEVEEAQGVALDDLAQVHQAAQLVGRGRDRDRHDRVPRLRRRQHVADRADAADARGYPRHLAVGPALAEPLEAAELHDVELGVGDVAGPVQEDADLGVPLDARYRVDDDAFGHGRVLLGQPNLSCSPSSRRGCPASIRSRSALMRSAGGGQPGRYASTVTISCSGRTRSKSSGTIPSALGSRGSYWALSMYAHCSTLAALSCPSWLRIAGTFAVTAQSPKEMSTLVRRRTSRSCSRLSRLHTAPSTRQTSTPSGYSLTSMSGL